ncbi:DUF3991 and toprim domain-containing protein [Shinella sp.]|uniref:DUF3991 and toprim domain-containing protein n=1 Tax=Shinella sp. TaxID=1870904 RepID=UPI0028AA3AFB|nr:DUF3991 and toprim domain-containing protein [Shinella sp.]
MRRPQGKRRRGGARVPLAPISAPLQPPLGAAGVDLLRKCVDGTGSGRWRGRVGMKREKIRELKEKVNCGALLERAGFAVDVKESTRRAVKFRRGGEIVIVTHEGKGWFDPLSDDKGDIFALVRRLDHIGFVEGVESIASLVGFQTSDPVWKKAPRERHAATSLADRWSARRVPWRGSATWRYLSGARFLPVSVLRMAITNNQLREGPYGSMWAAHTDEAGDVCGWEERGPEWRGFSTGGSKTLFRLGPRDGVRLCVTEAAIDAMSLAAFESLRDGSQYLSTGGGWSPLTDAALRTLASRPGVTLVAATDANDQGETFAERLRVLADSAGCAWQRLRPMADDWNEALQEKAKMEKERREEWKKARPAGYAPPASREASPGGAGP